MRGMVSPRLGGPRAERPQFFTYIFATFMALAFFFVLYETWSLTHAIHVEQRRVVAKQEEQQRRSVTDSMNQIVGSPSVETPSPTPIHRNSFAVGEGRGHIVTKKGGAHAGDAGSAGGIANTEVMEVVAELHRHQQGGVSAESTAAPPPPLTTTGLPPLTTTGLPPFQKKTNLDETRRSEVRKALLHSWNGYKENAWGKDEYHPIAQNGMNWANSKTGLGLTIVDALDTLLLAGLHDEAAQGIQWIEEHLSFDQPVKVSMFETTIRAVGGLISAYEMTKKKKLLHLAVDLADRMLPAFDTPSGVPHNYVHLKTKHHEGAGWNSGYSILSEFGSLQLEFKSLTFLTGDKRYAQKADNALQAIKSSCAKTGFCHRNYAGTSGQGGTAGLGSFGDSFYEYLLKQYVLSGRKDEQWKAWWLKAADHIIKTSNFKNLHFVPNGDETGNMMEHLACFSGGLFALSYHVTGVAQHLDVAERIASTCHHMYVQSPMGLSPDTAQFNGAGQLTAGEAKYILRPETVETYFYLWKITKKEQYREWGFAVLEACNKHLKVDGGYVGTTNTRVNSRSTSTTNDNMETFWFAETLKYMYLLFSEDELIDLDKVVFNTEAHPLNVIPDLEF